MIRQKIKTLIGFPEVLVEKSGKEIFGDYFTNIALKLARQEKGNPMEIAQNLIQKIAKKNNFVFKKIAVAPPGFINFTLSEEILREEVAEILKNREKYGRVDIGKGERIQVEFISANPTGPLTLGNGRGGFFGDVLSNVLVAAGYKVWREYFINDAGYQIEILGHSVLKDEQAQYQGDYIDELNKIFSRFTSEDSKKIGEQAADFILENLIQPTIIKKMGIKFDRWTSERTIRKSGLLEKIIKICEEKKLIYEREGALFFKSTQFGDDKDRVLITSSKGSRGKEATYLLPDAAYHYKKFKEDKFDKVINIWGADHHGYVARLQAMGKALEAWNENQLIVIIMQLVRLFRNGQEIKMSKRAGTYITLDELLEEISLDAARWFFLMRSPDTHMDFDLDLAKERSEKNPVYYAQYAYARICSLLDKAEKEFNLDKTGIEFLKLLEQPAELALIKQLIRLPEIVEDIACDYQVQRLPQYVLDLVRAFHKFYEECQVLNKKEEEKTQARLALCQATKIVLKNAFDLMGISAPEKM